MIAVIAGIPVWPGNHLPRAVEQISVGRKGRAGQGDGVGRPRRGREGEVVVVVIPQERGCAIGGGQLAIQGLTHADRRGRGEATAIIVTSSRPGAGDVGIGRMAGGVVSLHPVVVGRPRRPAGIGIAGGVASNRSKHRPSACRPGLALNRKPCLVAAVVLPAQADPGRGDRRRRQRRGRRRHPGGGRGHQRDRVGPRPQAGIRGGMDRQGLRRRGSVDDLIAVIAGIPVWPGNHLPRAVEQISVGRKGRAGQRDGVGRPRRGREGEVVVVVIPQERGCAIGGGQLTTQGLTDTDRRGRGGAGTDGVEAGGHRAGRGDGTGRIGVARQGASAATDGRDVVATVRCHRKGCGHAVFNL